MIKLETLKILFQDLDLQEKMKFVDWVQKQVNHKLMYEGDGSWSTHHLE